MLTALHLTEREFEMVSNLAKAHSQRLAGELRTRTDLTPAGRDIYLSDIDDVLSLLRKIKHAEGQPMRMVAP